MFTMPTQPILFDFISKTVFVAGTTPEADKQYGDFLAQQRMQTAAVSKPDSQ